MIAVITADLIESTQFPHWKKSLISDFNAFGKKNIDWSIYRGDGIQIRIENPAEALRYALLLKSIILQIDKLNVRIAIGLGDESEKTTMVTHNAGSAYVSSGRLLENIHQNLEIQSSFEDLNLGLNAGFALLNALCENWKPAVAHIFKLKLWHPEMNQKDIANKLKITQPGVSQALARGNWHEIEKYLVYFHFLIQQRA
ncbi:MAG: helix-turn-helix domain-containing protein [Flavobacteriaceae bacterium]|nr:helix-turn-helix domain-containing protein [Flavobacteriaceae bacterium]